MAGRSTSRGRPVTQAQTPSVDDPKVQRALEVLTLAVQELQARRVVDVILQGSGDPNGDVEAPVGSLYLRSDGGAVTTLYVRENTGASGWVAK